MKISYLLIVGDYSWEFRTENHDIKFGIVKKDDNGMQKEVIPIRRVAAHQLDEIGILTCEVPSTCEYTLHFNHKSIKNILFIILSILDSIIFDNTYSIMRNKKIHYSVKVIPPSQSQEIISATL